MMMKPLYLEIPRGGNSSSPSILFFIVKEIFLSPFLVNLSPAGRGVLHPGRFSLEFLHWRALGLLVHGTSEVD